MNWNKYDAEIKVTAKFADFAKNIRPKDAEKQAVSLRNGLEK